MGAKKEEDPSPQEVPAQGSLPTWKGETWSRKEEIFAPRLSQVNGITNLKGGKNQDQKIRPGSQTQGSNYDKMVEWVTSKTLRVQLLEFKYPQLCLLNVPCLSFLIYISNEDDNHSNHIVRMCKDSVGSHA